MKKIISILILLCLTVFCFAETNEIENFFSYGEIIKYYENDNRNTVSYIPKSSVVYITNSDKSLIIYLTNTNYYEFLKEYYTIEFTDKYNINIYNNETKESYF